MPRTWGELGFIGVVVLVVWLVKAFGRSGGPTPPSSFDRFRK